MPTVLDYASEMTGQIPGLSHQFARKFVNRALQEMKRDRLWSWNIGEGILITPQALTAAGTVAVTQWSANVTFDATARAAIAALSGHPPFTSYQFRLPGAPIYNILSYNSGTGVATLDRLFGGPTASGQAYQCYQCYYGPPSVDGVTQTTDFLRYLSINNNIQGYSIAGKRLYMTREELNRRDPLRGAQGLPYYAAAYRPTPGSLSGSPPTFATGPTLGQMLYELWPHPTYGQTLLCQYEKQHVDLQLNDYVPVQAPLSLIQYRMFEHAYRWAMANSARIPELKGVNWMALILESQAKYTKELVTAKKNDNEIMMTVLRPGTAGLYDFWGPIDSNFFQSHGLPSL